MPMNAALTVYRAWISVPALCGVLEILEGEIRDDLHCMIDCEMRMQLEVDHGTNDCNVWTCLL